MSLDEATKRIQAHKQSLLDAYNPPADFLEIDVRNPRTVSVAGNRFTEYEVKMRTNLPVFRLKEISVRRRYSDFEWLRNEIKKSVQINVPHLPGKAIFKQFPLLSADDGIFEDEFIEERRCGLEEFINSVAAHPLVQAEKCLHAFLQQGTINKDTFVPGKVRPSRS